MTPSDMPEKVSAERLREIVDGCEGVAPGPYSINHGSENHHHCRVFDDEGHEVMRTEWDKGLNAHRNISHFARLDPATVRSIGLELIEARAENAALKHDIERHIAIASSEASRADTMQRERDEAVRERDGYADMHQSAEDQLARTHARCVAAEAEVTRLREAVEPFAELVPAAFAPVWDGDEQVILRTHLQGDVSVLRISDFRRARSALSKDTP